MRALIIYESMYGNTRAVAEAVAAGLRTACEADVKPVAAVAEVTEAAESDVDNVDLLVVGGPTHAHGLSRPSSRNAAAKAAETDDDLTLEPGARGPGLREWLQHLDGGAGRRAAAFDTRLSAPPIFTGRSSLHVAKRLRQLGFEIADEPVSFFVDMKNRLVEGELERAQEWGRRLLGQAAERSG